MQVLEQWESENTFALSIEAKRKKKNTSDESKHFVFQEGPPTANGQPGLHHVLARTYKDLMCRWKTMQGFVVERKAGWDCHGLPVEREVEKTLGLSTAADVSAFGVDRFNEMCAQSARKYQRDWDKLTRRMGYWTDLENPYKTMDAKYMESEWWALKKLWEKGLLKKGYRVLPYSPKTGCTYSNRDLAEGYKQVSDLTCFVRMPLLSYPDSWKNDKCNVAPSMVAWTTTPWTLPANVLLAVNTNHQYSLVSVRDVGEYTSRVGNDFIVGAPYFKNGEVFCVAVDRLADLESTWFPGCAGSLEVLRVFLGSELLGLKYSPPFAGWPKDQDKSGPALWQVVHADFVTCSSGTGVVHVAPMYGEDDYNLCLSLGLGLSLDQPSFGHVVGLDGCYLENVADKHLQGLNVTCSQTQNRVSQLLLEKGLLIYVQVVTHDYPHCWRNKSHRLVYYGMESWFLTMAAPAVRSRMLELNEKTDFAPEKVKHGRFGSWLLESKDWCVSRNRTWGCPLPVWVCCPENGGCGQQLCVGSRGELRTLLVENTEQTFEDLHTTSVDSLRLRCPSCGNVKSMRREPYVLDCWFDSGCAPFAQWHYPFHATGKGCPQSVIAPPGYNQSDQHPVDFVAEAQDQCRGWFYSLHALSTTLFDRAAFKKCLVLGLVLDQDGKKMSKSLGNTVDPWTQFNAHGADATRWYLLSMCAPWADRRCDTQGPSNANRNFFCVLYNVSRWWLTNWSNVHAAAAAAAANSNSNISSDGRGADVVHAAPCVHPAASTISESIHHDHNTSLLLDRWVLSRLAGVVKTCNQLFAKDEFHKVTEALERFVTEDLSKTYVRLSRAYFSSPSSSPTSEGDLCDNTDKDSAAAAAASLFVVDLYQAQWMCLHTTRCVLLVLCRLVAPLAPFFVDKLHRTLMKSFEGGGSMEHHSSVHLAPWPSESDCDWWDGQAEQQVTVLQELLDKGRVLHEKSRRPGRFPLAHAFCAVLTSSNSTDSDKALTEEVVTEFELLLAFELNAFKVTLLQNRQDWELLLDQVQEPLLAVNLAQLRARLGDNDDADQMVDALNGKLLGASDSCCLAGHDDDQRVPSSSRTTTSNVGVTIGSGSGSAVTDDTKTMPSSDPGSGSAVTDDTKTMPSTDPGSNRDKSKKQLRREQRANAKKERQELKNKNQQQGTNSTRGLSWQGPSAEKALQELEQYGKLEVPTVSNATTVALVPTDFWDVTQTPRDGVSVSWVQPNNTPGSSTSSATSTAATSTGLVLMEHDEAVARPQNLISLYLAKEVIHFVSRMKKKLHQNQQLSLVSLDMAVVAVDENKKEDAGNHQHSKETSWLHPEHWLWMLMLVHADPAKSHLVAKDTPPSFWKQKQQDQQQQDQEDDCVVDCLHVKKYGDCPGFRVWVRLFP